MAISTDTTIASAIPRRGASAGHTALAGLLETDWSKGIPPGYMAVLERLKRLRGEYEEQIAAAIDGLDILDMAIADLEPEEDANEEDRGGEPSLGAPEAVTCSDGPATSPNLGRKVRRRTCQLASPRIDPSCDQSDWGGHGYSPGEDLELDTADDEPSLGAPDQPLNITSCVNGYWFTQPTDQADWAAGGSDDREGNLADTADDREAVNEDGGDVNDEPQDDNELDGHAYDDMEPGGDIPGGDRTRGRFRPSGDGPIGANDIGAGQRLVVGHVVEGGGVSMLGTVEAANG